MGKKEHDFLPGFLDMQYIFKGFSGMTSKLSQCVFYLCINATVKISCRSYPWGSIEKPPKEFSRYFTMATIANFFTWNDMWSIFSRLNRSTLGRHVVGRIPHLRPSVDFYILSIFLLPKGAQGTYVYNSSFIPWKFIYSEKATEIWRNLQKKNLRY